MKKYLIILSLVFGTNVMAQEFLNSEEGLEAQKQFEKDFLNYVVYGEVSSKDVFFKDLNKYCTTTLRMTPTEIIERFSDYLSEEQIDKLKDGTT